MDKTIVAPVIKKRKRRSSLEVLADKTIKNRLEAAKERGLMTSVMTVDIQERSVTIESMLFMFKNDAELTEYLKLENKKSKMLLDSVDTKKFDKFKYSDLSAQQHKLLYFKELVREESKDAFEYDKTEAEEGTVV